MDPIKKEIKQNKPESVIEKKSWITPEMEVHDIVEMTQSGIYSPGADTDELFNYS